MLRDRAKHALWGHLKGLEDLHPPPGTPMSRLQSPIGGRRSTRYREAGNTALRFDEDTAWRQQAARPPAPWANAYGDGAETEGASDAPSGDRPLLKQGARAAVAAGGGSQSGEAAVVWKPRPPCQSWHDLIKQQHHTEHLKRLVKMTTQRRKEFERNHAARVIQVCRFPPCG